MTDVQTGQAQIVVQPPAQHTVVGVASGAIDALKTSPVLLLIVLLNMTFVMVAGYFLLQVEAYRAANSKVLGDLIKECITKTVPMEYLEKQTYKNQQGSKEMTPWVKEAQRNE